MSSFGVFCCLRTDPRYVSILAIFFYNMIIDNLWYGLGCFAGTTETVVLSCQLLKINKRGKVQKRGHILQQTFIFLVFCSFLKLHYYNYSLRLIQTVLVVTNLAAYNFKTSSKNGKGDYSKFLRRMDLNYVTDIIRYHEEDDFILHMKNKMKHYHYRDSRWVNITNAIAEVRRLLGGGFDLLACVYFSVIWRAGDGQLCVCVPVRVNNGEIICPKHHAYTCSPITRLPKICPKVNVCRL